MVRCIAQPQTACGGVQTAFEGQEVGVGAPVEGEEGG